MNAVLFKINCLMKKYHYVFNIHDNLGLSDAVSFIMTTYYFLNEENLFENKIYYLNPYFKSFSNDSVKSGDYDIFLQAVRKEVNSKYYVFEFNFWVEEQETGKCVLTNL